MEGRQKMTGAGNLKIGQAQTCGNRQEGPNGDQATMKKQTGGVANRRETSKGRRRRVDAGVCIKASPPSRADSHHEKVDPSLVTQGCVGDKPCLVTVDTGAYVTVARPDIAAGRPERQPDQRFSLQTASGEALPILKEVFLTLTLGRRPLKIWVFVAYMTNEFIMGLDILRASDASVGLGRQTLRLTEGIAMEPRGEAPSFQPGSGQGSSNTCRVREIVMARLESPLGVENGLVGPSPQTHPPEEIYIARTATRCP
jgi:hypothetical protein